MRADAFELAGGDAVVVYLYRQAAHRGVQRRALGHCPRSQDVPELKAKVKVQRRHVMELDDEARDVLLGLGDRHGLVSLRIAPGRRGH